MAVARTSSRSSRALQSPPYGIAQWTLDPSSILADPGAGKWRVNGTEDDAVLALSQTATPSGDQASLLDQIVDGDRLVVQRVDNALRYLVVDLGEPTDHGVWWELPVVESVQWITPTPNRTFVFSFRHHVYDDDDPTVSPPAPLVPVYELDALVDNVTAALVVEVNADATRDADKLERAARTAIRAAEIHLDWPSDGDFPSVYPTAALVDIAVFDALVTLAAGSMKRPGSSYGVAGYDEADPLARRALGAVLADLAAGHKARWGVA